MTAPGLAHRKRSGETNPFEVNVSKPIGHYITSGLALPYPFSWKDRWYNAKNEKLERSEIWKAYGHLSSWEEPSRGYFVALQLRLWEWYRCWRAFFNQRRNPFLRVLGSWSAQVPAKPNHTWEVRNPALSHLEEDEKPLFQPQWSWLPTILWFP